MQWVDVFINFSYNYNTDFPLNKYALLGYVVPKKILPIRMKGIDRKELSHEMSQHLPLSC